MLALGCKLIGRKKMSQPQRMSSTLLGGQETHRWVYHGRTKMSKSPTIVIVSHILGYSSRWRVQYDFYLIPFRLVHMAAKTIWWLDDNSWHSATPDNSWHSATPISFRYCCNCSMYAVFELTIMLRFPICQCRERTQQVLSLSHWRNSLT